MAYPRKPFRQRKSKTGWVSFGKTARERNRKYRRGLTGVFTSGSIGIYHCTIVHQVSGARP
jgi:hypothetical protein